MSARTERTAAVTRQYAQFRGVDFSTDPSRIDPSRSPLCQNLVSDFGGYPEKRLGWRVLGAFAERINGLHALPVRLADGTVETWFLVHQGTKLQRFWPENGQRQNLYTTANDARSFGFVFGGKLYLLDGANYLVFGQFDGQAAVKRVSDLAYVPTTSIGRQPDGAGGSVFEAVNLIGKRRKNAFCGDGTSTLYHLDGQVEAGTVEVTVDGAPVTEGFTVGYVSNTVTFTDPPADGQGVDNVVISFPCEAGSDVDSINRCRFATIFGLGNDSRVFFSGNPDAPNTDWHSGLYDPTYVPDVSFCRIGADSSAIMGYLKQGDSLLILKADDDQDATVYLRTAALDESGEPVFPVQQGMAGVGAVSMHAFATLRDDPLFLSREGVFAPVLSYGIKQQRVMQNRSYFVDARLTREGGLDEAVATVWNGCYVLSVNGVCYVADGRQRTANRSDSAYGYEWYYWTNVPARVLFAHEDKLYFGTADGRVCAFDPQVLGSARYNDDGDAIDAFWGTKLDDDGDFMRKKTIPRRGTGVLIKPYAHASCEVAVRTDAFALDCVASKQVSLFDFTDLDFTRLSFEADGTPQIVPLNTPIKNYRAVQFIVRNREVDEGFGVFGITKRVLGKAYVK